MKTAAIIPVKTFFRAKTRMGLSRARTEELCSVMLEEVLRTLSTSPRIDETVMVTRDGAAKEIGERFGATAIEDVRENGVNGAVALADGYLLKGGFDASIVFPQDIPFIKAQDIDFMRQYAMHPNFAIIVPSRRFDGTNALARMPVDLMKTHYDEDSYKIHMSVARERTANAAMVFVRRIMWDVDNLEDLEFLLSRDEKPAVAARLREIAGL